MPTPLHETHFIVWLEEEISKRDMTKEQFAHKVGVTWDFIVNNQYGQENVRGLGPDVLTLIADRLGLDFQAVWKKIQDSFDQDIA